ncbi:hypothetical protein D3C79_707210 [compost metagenome]
MRVQHEAAYRFGDADADQAFRFYGTLAADFHHRMRGVQHAAAAQEGFFALFAQAQLAGSAMQQLQRQCLFEFRHAAAGGRGRGAQQAGSGGETAALHHLNENGHFGQQRMG